MENSKKVTILLAIVFLVVVLGIYYFNRAGILKIPGLKSPGIFEVKQEEDLLKKEVKLQEQMAEIVKTNDFEKCKQIKDETYQKACVNNIAMNLAKEKEDLSYCNKMDNGLVSSEICEKEAIFKKSLEKEDIRVCQEVKNNKIKEICEFRFWPNLALSKKNIDLCNNIENEDQVMNCRDWYFLNIEFSKDFDCGKFSKPEHKEDCELFKSLGNNEQLLGCGANFRSPMFNNKFCSSVSSYYSSF